MKAKPVTVNGKVFSTIRDAAAAYGVPYMTVARRLRTGWTVRQALGVEAHKRKASSGRRLATSAGTFSTVKAAAEKFGLDPGVVVARLSGGWTPDQALGLDPRARPPRPGSSIECGGQRYQSVAAFARAFSLGYIIVSKRLAAGWTPEQAVGLACPPPRWRNQVGGERGHKYREVEMVEGKAHPVTAPGQCKVYVVTNRVNGKQYVGITIGSLHDRLRGHFGSVARGIKSPFYNAIRKYGRAAFKIELIRCDAANFAELQLQEIEEIKRLGTLRAGYNVAHGGSLGTADPVTISGCTFASHAEAAQHYGIDPAVFNLRLGRLKWTPEETAEVVPRGKFSRRRVTVAGVRFASLKAAAEHFGIDYKLAHDRVVNKEWSVEQALEQAPAPDSAKYAGIGIVAWGKTFPSIGACARQFGIKAASLRLRLVKYGQTPDEAVAYLMGKPTPGPKRRA